MRKAAIVTGALLSSAVFLSGCGVGVVDHTTSGTLLMQGMVHGGQQAVSGSTVQLYTVGNGGNGSAATAMLSQPVVSDYYGNFKITGDYTCGDSSANAPINSPSNQVYIVATGGNPGLKSGTDNRALVMVAALGDCSKLPTTSFVEINEVTTAAAVWALSPFMNSATQVGATSTNVSGIENAFLNAGLLADTTTGFAPTALASNLTVETGKLYALADAIASCVNSDGTTGCNKLFTAATPSGGTAPADTLAAALNIVKHPGQNVAAVYNAIGTQPPFPTTLTQAPNDWTMSLTVTGGGLNVPTALDIDAQGVVWVANEGSPLSAFTPQGKPLSASGYGAGQFGQAYGLTIDSLGDIWVTNYNTSYNTPGAVTKCLGSASSTPGAVVLHNGNPGFYDTSLYYPYAVAADTNGNIFIANNGSSSATIYTSAGLVFTDPNGNPSTSFGRNLGINSAPPALAVDSTHGFWMTDANYSVAHISANGALISNTACCYGSYGVATDSFGNAWVANLAENSFSEVSSNGTTAINRSSVGGLQNPAFVAVDAGQNVWFTNYSNGSSITEIAGNGGAVPAGTPLSPSASSTVLGGYGHDSGLFEPYGIVPDRSGNVWVSSENSSSLVMFFGIATPTVTPIQPVPTAP
jgi:hypothetical protein